MYAHAPSCNHAPPFFHNKPLNATPLASIQVVYSHIGLKMVWIPTPPGGRPNGSG